MGLTEKARRYGECSFMYGKRETLEMGDASELGRRKQQL